MIFELKLRKFGNSTGFLLPAEALARLNAVQGDVVYLTETADGGLRLTAGDPEFGRKIKEAELFSRQYRNAIRELIE
jgi:putative addiction module antidote